MLQPLEKQDVFHARRRAVDGCSHAAVQDIIGAMIRFRRLTPVLLLLGFVFGLALPLSGPSLWPAVAGGATLICCPEDCPSSGGGAARNEGGPVFTCGHGGACLMLPAWQKVTAPTVAMAARFLPIPSDPDKGRSFAPDQRPPIRAAV
ncbi:hypothetical protein [Azospirillum sp. TSO5]|uniref:hypothetical protein n=1 Tax=Azospirillum sp. TSO5 TaxID=716760 RepID=UPI000D60489F|nr:hypothetical protein [Azospirillum sp. TSO5]PWC91106.1 hypothetical protein TSO5_19815 [Azospirillum sp. TSO5]